MPYLELSDSLEVCLWIRSNLSFLGS